MGVKFIPTNQPNDGERERALEKITGNSDKRLEIEDILCSKTTMKILKALRTCQRLNTSEITRMIRSNFADTASHLKLLEEQEILAHSNFGVRSRIYRFAESPRANAVKKLLEAWEQETEPTLLLGGKVF